jgi:hypothetical protein
MNKFFLCGVLTLISVSVTGCGESKPEIVADPNAYAPYQASPEELAAQQEQARQEASQPRR